MRGCCVWALDSDPSTLAARAVPIQPECVNDHRSIVLRWAGRSLGAALLVVAAGVLLVTVNVHAGGRPASCGSGWDVVSGRSGWRQWWAQDLADPIAGAPRLRTNDCVDAVNAHIVVSTVLGVAALAALAVAAVLGPRGWPPRAVRSRPIQRLHRLGTVTTVLGAVLTLAGLTGIALLTADPDATLFLYVSRPTVVLLGLLLLLPAVLLVLLGRGVSMLAEQMGHRETVDEPA